jgi:capsule biosynthesis phosphatase
MIIIIPLGGIGERFKQNGYKKPKALINILGKPILYYLLDNLNFNTNNIDFVSIPYNKEYFEYNFEDQLTKDFPNIRFKFYKLNTNTEGAAETINKALKTFNCEDTPILCLDGDNFYTIDIIKIWDGKNKIITFEELNDNPIYSYIKTNDNINVTDIIEKVKISNYACTGAYGFQSYKELLNYTQIVLDNNIRQKNEYYTSTVIKEMLKNNIPFNYSIINSDNYHCLGTPIQLKLFYNNFQKIQNLKIQKLRICFDLDNTLVTFPKIKNDYSTVEPIHKNIQLLKYLKSLNHTIIIYTARRMKTCNGNIGKVLSNIGKITFETLESFDIPFDEIYFGKPQADVYIDDLAVNCFDNIEKELGFYMENIEPRSFNTIENNVMNVITKKSDDLSGEIYYYKNIPISLKDFFPLFIDSSEDSKWFKIEKVTGLVLSNLYLSELLKENTLIDVMNSINILHNTKNLENNNDEINIYDNYSNKLRQRYETYDYSKFKNSKELYESLLNELFVYENGNKGKKTIIHGDPVFTNIIVNNYGKIKFIDMRGKIGKKLTIYGDEMYDWAKLYQSLIGYDSILLDKNVSENYSNKMKEVFETFFLNLYSNNDFNNMKLITKSLLFSLLPLHNNDKCFKYYELINNF